MYRRGIILAMQKTFSSNSIILYMLQWYVYVGYNIALYDVSGNLGDGLE